MLYIILIITAYLLGSIPFGYILTKMAGKGDVRKVGSGATGATNVARTAGIKLALLTIILDAAKAMTAVWIGFMFFGMSFGAIMGAVAILGHIY
ncbi:MAG: glycerol-3-phosphate acyltransferase, partial [Alphaproteobacteria bacterium]|nr:glycerol-3-phosphate acyltransferase [Alphaproteobacteria bacterium]